MVFYRFGSINKMKYNRKRVYRPFCRSRLNG